MQDSHKATITAKMPLGHKILDLCSSARLAFESHCSVATCRFHIEKEGQRLEKMRAMDETFSDDVDGFEDGAGWRCACGTGEKCQVHRRTLVSIDSAEFI